MTAATIAASAEKSYIYGKGISIEKYEKILKYRRQYDIIIFDGARGVYAERFALYLRHSDLNKVGVVFMKRIICAFVAVILLMTAVVLGASAATPEYKEGQILYDQDFSSLDALTSSAGYSAYGFGYNTGAATMSIENGALRLISAPKNKDGKSLSGRYGTRIRLYDVPDSVDRFSVSVDLTINSFSSSSASYGPALLIADNGRSDSSGSDKSSIFSMIWMRTYGEANTGAYTYGADALYNAVESGVKGFCTGKTNYNISIYINKKTNEAAFRIYNKDLGLYFSKYDFMYNPASVKSMVGLYANGCDVSVDNLTVYYGDGVFGGGYTPGDALETYPPIITLPVETEAPKETQPSETDSGQISQESSEGMSIGVFIAVELAVVAVSFIAVVALKKKKK